MTTTLPDRDRRRGGRWSSAGLVEELLDLAALERALAHVSAGWVPKVGELDPKLALAAGLEDTMERAAALRQHAHALLERDDSGLVTSPAVVEPMRALDARTNPYEVVDGIAATRSFLRRRYQDLEARLDPLFDARLLRTVRSAVATPEALGSERGHGLAVAAALDAAWSADRGAVVSLDQVLWPPVDRVPVPARPAGRRRPETGAMGFLRVGSRREEHNVAGELNENVMAELAAMELMCRCSYEHPDLPWAAQLAMARHAADEARHAAMFRRLLAQRGLDEAELTQHGGSYEYAYAYPECEPGSKRELVWRLIMLTTVLEALAIDKIPVEIGTQDFLGHVDIARALDYISADELFHAENGLRLTRRLCAEHHLDPMVERERVHGRYFAGQARVRQEYLARDPERAAWEYAVTQGPDPDGIAFRSRTEVELRRRASFTDDECDQVDRWGYNPLSDRSEEVFDPAAALRR